MFWVPHVTHIYSYSYILHGYIMNSEHDQLLGGLIAQLVEHCTGIAEVMGSNPKPEIFFRFFSQQCNSLVAYITARTFSSIRSFIRSAYACYTCYTYIIIFKFSSFSQEQARRLPWASTVLLATCCHPHHPSPSKDCTLVSEKLNPVN